MIGRGFSYALLRAVTGMEDAPLQTDGTARGSRHVVGPGRAAGIRLSLQIFHGRRESRVFVRRACDPNAANGSA